MANKPIREVVVNGNTYPIEADTSAIEQQIKQLNNDLSDKVSGFTETTYSAVTGLAYDSTKKKLGLKVGADTVIPFSSLGNGTLTVRGNLIVSCGHTGIIYDSRSTPFTLVVKVTDGVASLKSFTGGAINFNWSGFNVIDTSVCAAGQISVTSVSWTEDS